MSKRKLLLADDSMTIQKVVNLTFADEGIEVFTVGNGTAAVEKLTEIEPDLVLADVHMPGLTGYEVCENIRQNPQYKDIPVMLLVGSFEPFDEAEMRRVGANDFLTKPFQSIRQLVQKVTTLLDEAGTVAAPGVVEAARGEMTENGIEAPAMDFNATMPIAPLNSTQTLDESYLSNIETRETGLGDAGMDDEMIETTPVSNADSGNNYGEFTFDPSPFQANNDYSYQIETPAQVEETPEPEIRQTSPLSYADIQEIGSADNNYNNYQQNEPEEFQLEVETEERTVETPAVSYEFEKMPPEEGETAVYEINTDELELGVEPTVEYETVSHTPEPFQEQNFAFGFQDITAPAPKQEADAPILEIETESVAVAAPPQINLDDLDDDSLLDLQADEPMFEIPYPDELRAAQDEDPIPVMMQPTQQAEVEVLPPTEQPTVTPQMFDEQTNAAIVQITNQAVAQMNDKFPADVIDAIAQRVVEKLSDKVIEKIAWEIVPDRFDLIVRKHIESRDR
jgi:CheY-like chemotaxis protein